MCSVQWMFSGAGMNHDICLCIAGVCKSLLRIV